MWAYGQKNFFVNIFAYATETISMTPTLFDAVSGLMLWIRTKNDKITRIIKMITNIFLRVTYMQTMMEILGY